MKSRMQKWAHYRKKIMAMPDSKFPARKAYASDISKEDGELIKHTAVSKSAVSLAGIGGKEYHSTPYEEYQVRQRVYLVLKIVLLIAVVAALSIFYFYWVKE